MDHNLRSRGLSASSALPPAYVPDYSSSVTQTVIESPIKQERMIPVYNSDLPSDRKLAKAWRTEDSFIFENGPDGDLINIPLCDAKVLVDAARK